jgi:hypothetical protein
LTLSRSGERFTFRDIPIRVPGEEEGTEMKVLWSKVFQKVIGRGVQAAIALIVAKAAALGIELSPAELMIPAMAGLEGLRNYLKRRFPKVFAWLW